MQCLITLTAGFSYTGHNCFFTMSESHRELDTITNIIKALAMHNAEITFRPLGGHLYC